MVPQLITYETRSGLHIECFYESARRAGLNVVNVARDTDASSRFETFRKEYFHCSPNPIAFEMACFARYFALSDWMKATSTHQAILCDTDLMFSANAQAALQIFIEPDCPVMLSRPLISGWYENFPELSPHFSYWTTDALEDFLDYLLSLYASRSGKDYLAHTYREAKRLRPRAGISDMTLLYLWIQSRKRGWQNACLLRNALCVDHNIGMSIQSDRHKMQMEMGMKRLRFLEGLATFETESREPVTAVVMHCQGRYKWIMADILRSSVPSIICKSLLISTARTTRAWANRAMNPGTELLKT